MANTGSEQAVRRATLGRLASAALDRASSVKLGLALLIGIAVYAAAGTIPLGRLFLLLGGAEWALGRTVRHLPWIDLRESEYYSTALFAVMLLLLVVNMTLATVLRIRWEWRKAGVILTHAGVVVLALGAYTATRNPLNATMAVFADEPAQSAIDRSRTLLSRTGPDPEQWRMDDRLARYADFGVPWTARERAISLGDGVRITGYAHSSRLVPRLAEETESNRAGWQLIERLRTGESRTFVLLAGALEESRVSLSDGTVVLALDEALPLGEVRAQWESAIRQRTGVIRIVASKDGPTLLLPAVSGAAAIVETPEGVWQADFLDRSEFVGGTVFGNFRLEGPGFPSSLMFTTVWEPRVTGRYSHGSDDEAVELMELPEGFRALFMDTTQSALVISEQGWLHSHRGDIRGDAPLNEGEVVQLSQTTGLEVERVLPHARIVEQLERVPQVEDAQLLADPRIGSLVRISDSRDPKELGDWIAFDDAEQRLTSQNGLTYGPEILRIDDTQIIFRGFEAELFRRGSVPRDFLVDLEIRREDSSHHVTLSLNQPVRVSLKIDGVLRRVQLSLIGWDSEGWEIARASGHTDERFEGARYAVLSLNQREGVDVAVGGGVLIFCGAGVSMIARVRRSGRRGENRP
ncbi:MAG: hypothetical protein ACNA8P_05900 [Phycisphaerales bacterium]